MANQPQRDDQAKKPDGSESSPKTPKPVKGPPTPKPGIPNMSIDDSIEAMEVVEEPAPVVQRAPDSDVRVVEPEEEAIVLSEDAVIEDVEEAQPVSDVFLAEEASESPAAPAETPEPRVVESHPASDVVPSDGPRRQPTTGVAPREPIAAAPPISDVAAAEEIIEEAAPVSDIAEASPISDIAEASPISDVAEASPISDIAEAAPISDIAEASPISDVAASVLASSESPSKVIAREEVVATSEGDVEVPPLSDVTVASPSDVIAADETPAAAPASDVVATHEPSDVIPDSSVFAEEVVASAAPEPPSDLIAGEEAIEEAAPISDIVAAEEIIEEAAPVSGVLEGEEIVEAAPASEVLSGEVVEEAAEAVDEPDIAEGATEFMEPSSAVLEAEPAHSGSSAVLYDEVGEPGSVGKPKSDFDKTVAFEGSPSSVSRKGQPDSLVTEEEIVGTSEASAVELGELPPRKGTSSATGIDKVAEALESGVEADAQLAETVPPEPSVEFDELLDEDVETPRGKKKGKAISEESTEMDADALEFDDDIAEAAEAVEEAEEAEAVEAAEEVEEQPVSKKKKKTEFKKTKVEKKKTKAVTGDDIDLDAIMSEGEAVGEAEEAEEEGFALDGEVAEAAEEAEEAEEAAEAEAAEAFDEEVQAGDDDPDQLAGFGDKKKKPAKKGKKPADDEDDETKDEEDEDDELEARKKKKKDKKKEKATVAPRYEGPGFVMRWAGRFFLVGLGGGLLLGILAGAFFVLPDDMKKQAAEQLYTAPPPPKKEERKQIDRHREMLASQQYSEVATQLASASSPEELDLRGQAKWFGYYKEQTEQKKPLDINAPPVKEAIADLTTANKDHPLIQQIKTTVSEKSIADQLAKSNATLAEKDKEITMATEEKLKAEKLVDDVAEVLAKGKIIEDKSKLDLATLPKILKGLNDDSASLAAVNKVLKDNDIKGTGETGLTEVLNMKAEAEKTNTATNKALADAGIQDPGAKGVAKLADERNSVAKDRKELLDTLGSAFKELVDGKIVTDPKADPRKEIVKGVQQARLRAESPLAIPVSQLGLSLGNIGMGTSKAVEQTFDLAKVFSELGFFKTREPFIQSPQQKMNTYITLLQDRSEKDAKSLNAIIREADWVLSKDAKSDPEAQAKARYVQGLALRNQERFADAKTAFEESIKLAQPVANVGEWNKLAQQSLKELTDPQAYYVPRIDRFQNENNLKAALTEANVAIKAMPEEPRLYAVRGLVRYELVRGQAPKIPETSQKAIREDAETAGKDEKLAPEANYIVGLLEESLGNWPEAEKLYKMAIKMNEDKMLNADDAGKYRIALARLLLRDRSELPPIEEKKIEEKKIDEKKNEDKKGEDKKDLGATMSGERVIVMHPWSTLVGAAIVAQPKPEDVEDKDTLARYQAAIDEANKLIASNDPLLKGQGHMLLGIAYSKLGRRTEGLKEYAKGLGLVTTKTKLTPREIDDLIELIDNHPAFQQPDVAGVANPVMAERHFGEGIHLYWSKQYPEAEAQFRQAVKYYDRDARYQYYLGLSQLAQKTQKKRDAGIYSIEQGARLESRTVTTNPFAAREINASLERIQGELRQYLNGIRYKVQAEELQEKTKGL